jgi:hypothetical protein
MLKMTADLTAGRLQQGDEFVMVSRKDGKLKPKSHLVTGFKESGQQNNEQVLGESSDGKTISVGKNTKVKKVTSQGLLSD